MYLTKARSLHIKRENSPLEVRSYVKLLTYIITNRCRNISQLETELAVCRNTSQSRSQFSAFIRVSVSEKKVGLHIAFPFPFLPFPFSLSLFPFPFRLCTI